ncbi:hypothetical protein ACJQWK_10159 [Exserohilum turcicum]
MLTTAKSSEEEKNPLSDKEYETPAEEQEFPAAPTKHEKMARFKEKNRPATPKPAELESTQEEPRWDLVQQTTPPSTPQWAQKAQEAWRQSQKEY